MQQLHFPLRLLAAVMVFLLFSLNGLAQRRVVEMKDSTGLHSFSVQGGDTVLIGFDSAYVMNKTTFNLYQEAYRKVKKGDPATKRLIDTYESLISLQDSMLREKEYYYQSLKSNFDSLANGSNVFLKRTGNNIQAIDSSLTTVTNQLLSIRSLLDSSLEKLKKESRLKFAAAVKGFLVGVGVATVIFLVTK